MNRFAPSLAAARGHALRLIAAGAPLAETLAYLCRQIELEFKGSICTVMGVAPGEERLHLLAGPSLPKAVVDGIAGGIPIAPGAGACGTAASERRDVCVADVATDPLFDAWRSLALDNGLRACWSSPIVSGSTGEVLGTFSTYHRAPGYPTALEITFQDALRDLACVAIEHHRLSQQAAYDAMHDLLTGLPNRSLLLDRLGRAIARLDRRPGMVALLFCDIDRFRVLNDSLGHDAGDRVLKELAQRLTSTVRAGDTVARFGGDELVVLCEDLSSEADLTTLAERTTSALREPFSEGEDKIHVTWSMGISVTREPSASSAAMLRDAETAMHRAKSLGKNRYEIFDEQMRDQALRRLEIESALWHAIEREELQVHYQPELSVADRCVVGVEALVRWERPTRGLVLPNEFIRIAEDTGVIIPIGVHVLERACEQAVALQDNGSPIKMSVNLSTRQLGHPDLIKDVQQALERTGLDPDRLYLEITEGSLVNDTEEVISVLDGLRRLGVHLSIDDFGTGYSSFNYLERLPVSTLKIDRSFMPGLDANGGSATVKAIVNLAHELGLGVVAEGVETATQFEKLRSYGCDAVQGWLFAKAMPPEQLMNFIDGSP